MLVPTHVSGNGPRDVSPGSSVQLVRGAVEMRLGTPSALRRTCPSLTAASLWQCFPKALPMPAHLGCPPPQRMAPPLPTLALWGSFPTLPPSLGPGAGLGSPASLLLPGGDSRGAHGLPIPGWRAPGVARRGVWLCWCSLELPPPSFLLEAEGLEADGWPNLGTGLQVPSGRALQTLCAGCLRGVSFVIILKA